MIRSDQENEWTAVVRGFSVLSSKWFCRAIGNDSISISLLSFLSYHRDEVSGIRTDISQFVFVTGG